MHTRKQARFCSDLLWVVFFLRFSLSVLHYSYIQDPDHSKIEISVCCACISHPPAWVTHLSWGILYLESIMGKRMIPLFLGWGMGKLLHEMRTHSKRLSHCRGLGLVQRRVTRMVQMFMLETLEHKANEEFAQGKEELKKKSWKKRRKRRVERAEQRGLAFRQLIHRSGVKQRGKHHWLPCLNFLRNGIHVELPSIGRTQELYTPGEGYWTHVWVSNLSWSPFFMVMGRSC